MDMHADNILELLEARRASKERQILASHQVTAARNRAYLGVNYDPAAVAVDEMDVMPPGGLSEDNAESRPKHWLEIEDGGRADAYSAPAKNKVMIGGADVVADRNFVARMVNDATRKRVATREGTQEAQKASQIMQQGVTRMLSQPAQGDESLLQQVQYVRDQADKMVKDGANKDPKGFVQTLADLTTMLSSTSVRYTRETLQQAKVGLEALLNYMRPHVPGVFLPVQTSMVQEQLRRVSTLFTMLNLTDNPAVQSFMPDRQTDSVPESADVLPAPSSFGESTLKRLAADALDDEDAESELVSAGVTDGSDATRRWDIARTDAENMYNEFVGSAAYQAVKDDLPKQRQMLAAFVEKQKEEVRKKHSENSTVRKQLQHTAVGNQAIPGRTLPVLLAEHVQRVNTSNGQLAQAARTLNVLAHKAREDSANVTTSADGAVAIADALWGLVPGAGAVTGWVRRNASVARAAPIRTIVGTALGAAALYPAAMRMAPGVLPADWEQAGAAAARPVAFARDAYGAYTGVVNSAFDAANELPEQFPAAAKWFYGKYGYNPTADYSSKPAGPAELGDPQALLGAPSVYSHGYPNQHAIDYSPVFVPPEDEAPSNTTQRRKAKKPSPPVGKRYFQPKFQARNRNSTAVSLRGRGGAEGNVPTYSLPPYDPANEEASYRDQAPAAHMGSQPRPGAQARASAAPGLIGRAPGHVNQWRPTPEQLHTTVSTTGIPGLDRQMGEVHSQRARYEEVKDDEMPAPGEAAMTKLMLLQGKEKAPRRKRARGGADPADSEDGSEGVTAKKRKAFLKAMESLRGSA